MQYPTELDRAWAAGLFDGEGSVSISLSFSDRSRRKKRHNLSAQIAMTDLPTLQRLERLFGGKVYNHQPGGEKRRRSWVWQLWGQKSYPFLRSIRPFLQTKAFEVELMLDALRIWSPLPPIKKGQGLSEELWALREGYRLALKESRICH